MAAHTPLTWFITGCSAGFGLALARHALSRGDNVIATSRNPSRTPDLVDEIRSNPRGAWVAFDVTASQDQQNRELVEADSCFGGIDVLVNNAAFSALGAVEDIPEEVVAAQFATNVFGLLRTCKACIPHMRTRRAGTIVNVTSLLGMASWPGVGVYSASKFAVEGLSETLAAELLPFGIRTLIVQPGAFRTNFLASMNMTPASEPYAAPHPVAAALEEEERKNGTQPNDPELGARAIYDAVVGTDGKLIKAEKGVVLRVPLGKDCWEGVMQKLEGVRRDYAQGETVARSMEFTAK